MEMKEFSTECVIYLEVHNCVVCFTGHATPFIQTDYTSLKKIIYTLQNLIFGNESQVC